MNPEFLKEAINQAKLSLSQGGIPIGAVITYNGKIIGKGHNQRIQKGSVILHGEMDAFENAGREYASVFKDCELYTTLSPCHMCTGTILLYGIKKVYIGENQTFKGAEDLLASHGIEFEVLNNEECINLMQQFIEEKPQLWNEDIGK